MICIPTIACGTCVYISLWHKFPPTASWVLIIPAWFLLLSAIRTWTDTRLSTIPNIYVAIPLVLAVFFLTRSWHDGPPLGFWIPVCCVVGTWTGYRRNKNTPLAKTLLAVTLLTGVGLVAFGARDYHQYNQMTVAEKEKRLPVWEVMEKRRHEAGYRLPFELQTPSALGRTSSSYR